jgi:hypothetical protein
MDPLRQVGTSWLYAEENEVIRAFADLDDLVAEPLDGEGELFLTEDPNGFRDHGSKDRDRSGRLLTDR